MTLNQHFTKSPIYRLDQDITASYIFNIWIIPLDLFGKRLQLNYYLKHRLVQLANSRARA